MSVQKLTIDLFGFLKVDAEVVSENGSIQLLFKGLKVTGLPHGSSDTAAMTTKRTEVSPVQSVSDPIEDMAMAAAAGPPKGGPDLGIVNHLGEKTASAKSEIVPEFLSPPGQMLTAPVATTSTVLNEVTLGPVTAVTYQTPVSNPPQATEQVSAPAASEQSPLDTQMDVFSQFAVINHAVPEIPPPTNIGGVPTTEFLPMTAVPESVRPDVQGAYEKLMRKEDSKIRFALSKLSWPAGTDISGIERLDRPALLTLAFNVLVNTAIQKK